MAIVHDLAQEIGVKLACEVFSVYRSSYYHWLAKKDCVKTNADEAKVKTKYKPANALSEEEKQRIYDLLYSEEYCNLSPTEVYAIELEHDRYHCSIKTMYRLLREKGHGDSWPWCAWQCLVPCPRCHLPSLSVLPVFDWSECNRPELAHP